MLHYITPCKLDVEWSEAATWSRRTSQTTSPLPVRATERVPPTGPGRPRRPVRAVLIRRSGRTTPSLQADLSREPAPLAGNPPDRSEEHTSELQSLMRISYAVFCLKKKKKT